MIKFQVADWAGEPAPMFCDEPELRGWLLSALIHDLDGQEDLYLSEIAKAEAGETILDLYNHFVHVYLFPSLVVLEDMSDPSLEEEGAEGPRRCTFLTLQEAKQLILDWVEAKRRWYADRQRREAN